MSQSTNSVSGSGRLGAELTRRSLVAAAGILAALGPAAAGRALATGPRHGPSWNWNWWWRPPPRPNPPPHHHHPHKHNHSQHDSHKCLLVGTGVLTPSGEVPVETLQIGDLVVTKDGIARDIRWIGRTVFERNGKEPWAEGALPICIAKDAIGAGCPHRDLFLSRGHLLYLNGVLIPAGDLVNGRTITVVHPEMDRLEYFHIELDRHDVLLVEGLACESLLASAESRSTFGNAEEQYDVIASLPSAAMAPCAPLAAYNGGRSALRSRLRSALAPVIDIRHAADIARDDIEARAYLTKAA